MYHMKQSFYICTVACMRKRTDNQKIYDYMIKNGFKFESDYGKADMIFIDTCAYCQMEEDNSVNAIQRCLDYKKESAQIIVLGCLPAINPLRLEQMGKLHCVPSGRFNELDKFIKPKIDYDSIPDNTKVRDFYSPFVKEGLNQKVGQNNLLGKYGYTGNDVNHVKVATGCLGNCSYCAIKLAWGKLKSRPLEDILKDFKRVIKNGAKEVTLEAHDLSSYGLDIDTNVVALLRGVFGVEGDYKLVLHDFNPLWLMHFYKELKEILVNNHQRIKYINIPVQSGSNRILKLMHRPYKIEQIKEMLSDLMQAAPSLWVLCDIMIGFPGETSEDFEETKMFVKEMGEKYKINYWFTKFSVRPNTEAEKMENKVDEKTKEERENALRMVLSSKAEPAVTVAAA